VLFRSLESCFGFGGVPLEQEGSSQMVFRHESRRL